MQASGSTVDRDGLESSGVTAQGGCKPAIPARWSVSQAASLKAARERLRGDGEREAVGAIALEAVATRFPDQSASDPGSHGPVAGCSHHPAGCENEYPSRPEVKRVQPEVSIQSCVAGLVADGDAVGSVPTPCSQPRQQGETGDRDNHSDETGREGHRSTTEPECPPANVRRLDVDGTAARMPSRT